MKVIVATGNAGKMREFRRILEPLGFQVTSMKEEGIDVPIVEDGTTFAENARIKAMTVHQHTGEAVIADDSGICVDALGGRPGVYSARYGGEDLPHPEKIKLLLSELRDTPPEQRAPGMSALFTLCWQTVGNMPSMPTAPAWWDMKPEDRTGLAMTRSFISASAALPNTVTRKRTGSATGARRSGRWRRRSDAGWKAARSG